MAPRQSSASEPSSKSSSSTDPGAASISDSRTGAGDPARPLLFFHYLTLFPEVFEPILRSSLLGKAIARGRIACDCTQIRDFATDRHRTVDDTPYGGGDGMILKPDVLHSAWKSARSRTEGRVLTVLLSPQGGLFDQQMAKELAAYDHLILVCGHYEGVDERFVELCVDREVSIGDYVLTGGELPALVMTDAICRWVPGVVGKEASVANDSLEGGLLKYPQYTRPRVYEGREVPEVLMSGNHGEITRWREAQMEERTARKRPDLWAAHLQRK